MGRRSVAAKQCGVGMECIVRHIKQKKVSVPVPLPNNNTLQMQVLSVGALTLHTGVHGYLYIGFTTMYADIKNACTFNASCPAALDNMYLLLDVANIVIIFFSYKPFLCISLFFLF